MSEHCLFCYDEATDLCPFIEQSPCNCKGSMKIHRHCYELTRTHCFRWTNTEDGMKGKCSVCHAFVNPQPFVSSDFNSDETGLAYTQYKTVQVQGRKKKVKHGYVFTYVMMDGLKKLYAYELFNNNVSCGKIEIVFPGQEKEINLKMTDLNQMIQNTIQNNIVV